MTRARREKRPAPLPAVRRKPRLPAQPAAAGDSGAEPGLRELRSSIGNLRAAAEALATAAIPRPERSARASGPAALLQAVLDEAERASRAVDRLAALLDGPAGGTPRGEVVSAAELAAEVVRRAAADLDLAVQLADPIADDLTVAASFSPAILGALGRLRRDFSVAAVELSARRHADLLAFEFAFSAREPEASRLRDEHPQVLAGGAHGEPSLGAAARAAGGEAWLAIRRGEATFSLRLLLPLAGKP